MKVSGTLSGETKKSVDGDVAFDIMGSFMMRITYMLREIELMTLIDVIYIGYIDDINFTCILFFIRIQQKWIN